MVEGVRPRIHHVGVQTADLDNCLQWYLDFFGAEKRWELDRFSDLTLSRLPGIGRLVEIAVGDLRFHLFDRSDHNRRVPEDESFQFQHVCLQVDTPEDLEVVRGRWIELYDSGRFAFARQDPPTDIVIDGDGVRSLYLFDVNGLEYEFTHVPEGPR
ncbi:VOC family protein [Streptomyces calidiresistens]|uniref:VOC family protein n=2 Tax=Streptomyces calidiresistens TaxID=1485586 RepID=A0A7W3XUM9_9ACTN|nr:VOC family protein [Streptomyces calidiresistens]